MAASYFYENNWYLKLRTISFLSQLMKSVSDECPNITHVYTLGRSSKGREIIAMVISGNPREHEIGRNSFHTTKKLADKTFHLVMKHTDKIDRN